MTRLPRLLSLDVETAPADHLPATDDPKGYALEPCRLRSRQAQLLSFAVGQGSLFEESVGFYKPKPETVAAVLQGAVDTSTPIVCWNSTFDVAWLIALGLKDLVFKVLWLDGMLLKRHANNQMNMTGHKPLSYGLKPSVEERYPGYGDYGSELKDKMGALHRASPRKVVRYNRFDAMYTWDLAQHYWAQLAPEQRELAKLEGLSIPMFAETLVEGMDVDVERAREMDAINAEKQKLAMVSLSLLVSRPVTSDVLSSPDQLTELLVEAGVPLSRRTATGKLSSNADVLAPFAKDFPVVEHALIWRGAHKIRSTYTRSVIDAAAYNPDGKVRPQARMFGTYTGRLTFSSSNRVRGPGKREGTTRMEEVQTGIPIHQWPRDPDIRAILEAPPGMTIVEADFKGQEYRWMAEYSRDTQMIRCCEPDIDAHVVMGASINSMGYDALIRQLHSEDKEVKAAAKNIRQLGKVGNLACQYRIGVPTLRDRAESDYGVVLTDDEASHVRNSFKLMYKAVPRYWKRAVVTAFNDGHVTTYGGRRIFAPGSEMQNLRTVNKMGWGVQRSAEEETGNLKRWQLEQTSINGPIQGSGADQKYLALGIARDYILSIGGRLWMDLHDGLYFLVPDAVARVTADYLHALLSNLPYAQVWGKTPCVQFPVEVKMGKVWGQLQVVHE